MCGDAHPGTLISGRFHSPKGSDWHDGWDLEPSIDSRPAEREEQANPPPLAGGYRNRRLLDRRRQFGGRELRRYGAISQWTS